MRRLSPVLRAVHAIAPIESVMAPERVPSALTLCEIRVEPRMTADATPAVQSRRRMHAAKSWTVLRRSRTWSTTIAQTDVKPRYRGRSRRAVSSIVLLHCVRRALTERS
jgi:hypothetical protein